jgi:hypothetical protein
MKKLLFFLFILALTATNFSCKKSVDKLPTIPVDTIPIDSSKIDTNNYDLIIKNSFNLNKLSVDSFKKILHGKWRFHTGYYVFKGSFVEFNFYNTTQDSLKHYNDSIIFANGNCFVTKHQWSGTDSINLIKFNTLPSGDLWFWKTYLGNKDSIYIYEPERQYLIIKVH